MKTTLPTPLTLTPGPKIRQRQTLPLLRHPHQHHRTNLLRHTAPWRRRRTVGGHRHGYRVQRVAETELGFPECAADRLGDAAEGVGGLLAAGWERAFG